MEQASKNSRLQKPRSFRLRFPCPASRPGELPEAFQLSRPAEPGWDCVRTTPTRLLSGAARLGLPVLLGSYARRPWYPHRSGHPERQLPGRERVGNIC